MARKTNYQCFTYDTVQRAEAPMEQQTPAEQRDEDHPKSLCKLIT